MVILSQPVAVQRIKVLRVIKSLPVLPIRLLPSNINKSPITGVKLILGSIAKLPLLSVKPVAIVLFAAVGWFEGFIRETVAAAPT